MLSTSPNASGQISVNPKHLMRLSSKEAVLQRFASSDTLGRVETQHLRNEISQIVVGHNLTQHLVILNGALDQTDDDEEILLEEPTMQTRNRIP
jgi:hypothetical protein